MKWSVFAAASRPLADARDSVTVSGPPASGGGWMIVRGPGARAPMKWSVFAADLGPLADARGSGWMVVKGRARGLR